MVTEEKTLNQSGPSSIAWFGPTVVMIFVTV